MTASRIDATDTPAGGGMADSNVIPFPAPGGTIERIEYWLRPTPYAR